MDVGQLKIQLATRAEDVCKTLLPKGKRNGAEWRVGSTEGEQGQSLGVHLTGDKAGVWSDFADGKGGDLLDLYTATRGGNISDAIRWAKDFLGVVDPEFHRMPAKEYRKPVVKNARIPQNGTIEYLTKTRGLVDATIKAFQLGEIHERSFRLDGDTRHTCAAVVFPFKTGAKGELKFVKYLGVDRPEGKKLIDAEAGCEPVLFGWQTIEDTTREVVITEGEFNAASWFQYGIPALATPFGAGKGNKHTWIGSEWERLEQFETIYLNFDEDKPGREAVADLVERLGRHRCRIVPPMPGGRKDVNDCLVAGVDAGEIQALLAASKTSDPKELRSASEFTDDVIERFYPGEGTHQGIPMPFDGFGNKFSFRRGELTIVTGTRGHGKTQALNWIHAKAMQAGDRVCIASFEMPARVLLQRMVRQITAQRIPSEEYIRRVMQWLSGKLWIYDHVGSVDRKRLMEVFEYATRRYGITYFVIDSLMKCGVPGDDYNGQDEFSDDLDGFAQKWNAHVTLVAHSRKGKAEDEVPGNDEVKGSGGITDKAWNVVSIWRNKGKELAVQKMLEGHTLTRDEERATSETDAIWFVDKQREGDGWIGKIPLDYDGDSQQFITAKNPVKALVPFSTDESSDDEIPEF